MSLKARLRYEYEKLHQRGHYQDECRKMEERKNGIIPSQFHPLKELAGCCKGKRCFIIGDANRLTDADIQRLQHEITFGTCRVLQQERLCPDYIAVQNPQDFKRIEQKLHSYTGTIFVGDNLAEICPSQDKFIQYPYLGVYKYYLNAFGECKTLFSDNALEVVYDGYHVLYSILQLAVYLGFSECCLIGCNCWHTEDQRLRAAYQTAADFAVSQGIFFINCTHGEDDDIFPYRALEQIEYNTDEDRPSDALHQD